MGILCSVGFLEIVPAVSNKRKCFGIWNANRIHCGSEVVKKFDFNWNRAICCVVVRAVLMTKLCTEGGWMLCLRW